MKCPLFRHAAVQPWAAREVPMVFAATAVERAMKIQEVIMRALAGTLTWLQAADILGLDPRSVRRWRARYEDSGHLALYEIVVTALPAARRWRRRCSGFCACTASGNCRRRVDHWHRVV